VFGGVRFGSEGAGLVSKPEVIGINLLKREPKKLAKIEARIRAPKGKLPFTFDRGTIVILVLVAIFLLAFGGYAWHLSSSIKAKEKLLTRKRAELKKLEKVYARIGALETKRKELERMVKVVEKLSAGRERMVHFFGNLEATIPPISWLSSLEFEGENINMKGYTLEDRGVADFMDNLTHSSQISRCKLGYIKEVKFSGMRVKEFSLSISFK
jgi:Tfp pilus assembly protein PilN